MVNAMQNHDEPQLTPKTGLVVLTAPALSAAQQAVLAELYLPLIGPLAYSLYAALRSLQSSENELSNRRSHAELLGVLNVDLPTVLAARQKLEATGLLRSYFQQDELGAVYIYQLQAPLLAQQFFADDLLSVLLLDTVGEHRFQQLTSDFTAQPVDLKRARDVSASILDVFHIASAKVTQTPLTVQKARAQLAANEPAERANGVLTDDQFDWQLLGQILNQNYVDTKQVARSRQLIITESRVYGINEVEMAKLISEVASLTTGQFDENQLKLMIARRYERPTYTTPVQATTQAAAVPTSAQPQATKAAQTAASQFEPEEQQLIAYTKQRTPYDFIADIKQENHGFVTTGENRLIHELVGRHQLTDPVINMLIYYVLQDRERAALNRNLLETVANDWQRHGVDTPEAALQYVRKRQQAQSQPRTSQRRNRTNRPTRKEVMPKWAQEQAQGKTGQATGSKNNQLTAAQRKQLAERVAKYDTDSQKGD
ncbi:replication initiation and membrane attachment family protein [Lactiplantibacillus modestisalitolerans]|uniref:Replication initiation and membrane attachment family protein n=1 Tax=Lactiplantibacillus modestisalitolerans TaxID=1457219 RepID=A0ABV5WWY2_9LACO|nr:DnaD domain protein [Lactiplantibacillus modestisalitolerans]